MEEFGDLFSIKKNETMLKKIKRLAEEKNKKNKIVKFFNGENNKSLVNKGKFGKNSKFDTNIKEHLNSSKNSYSKNFSSFSKKKRRLYTHSEQGAITNSILKKENQKLLKTIKIFNKTYLAREFKNIKKDWLKEEEKIKKYVINAERTIDLSVLKLASIITEDKMNSLKEILYFKHNQISSYINEFLNLTELQTNNYINILTNSSEMLGKTFEEINKKIIFNFLELKDFITGQIREIKGANDYEEIDGNERLNNLYNSGYFYQPIEINFSNDTNKKRIDINFTKSNTITKYYKLLKYSKYLTFNDINKKFKDMNDILDESKSYLIKKRRMSETSSSSGGGGGQNTNGNSGNNNNGNNNNNNNNKNGKNDAQEIGIEFDIMKGKLSIQYDIPLKEINLIKDDFVPIPIIEPLCIVLEPAVKFGFYISLGFETKLYDDIIDTDIILKKLDEIIKGDDEEEEEDEYENDSKIIIKLSAKGEISCAASAGLVLGDQKSFLFSILAGIKGLLGSGEIGFGLIYNLDKTDVGIDRFYEIQAFHITLFVKIEIIINLLIVKFKFEIYIIKFPSFGLTHGKHDVIYLKVFAKKLYEQFIISNKNQLN